MTPEILAPAGSREALTAAVRCGADAVYLGSKAFNARRNASNFSGEELKEAVDYCHRHGVKVYVTLNTLASDSELKNVYREIEDICSAGADAFIIQDVGLASIVRQVCPSVPMHASTQMSVQSADGIRILEELGFCRAVLPRELSEKEIRSISSQTDMELEYFVHGALCMCVSGQCLMSSTLGGRSGNRGLCAQPCRLPFGVNGSSGYNLSLKDLSLIDKIPALASAGVCSLKIEGRMKRPEYVAAAVTACRNSINGIKDKQITDALGAVFSRSGFTSGYFDGKLGRDMFGIRTKDDVINSSAVLTELSHLYDNENPLIPVNMYFTMRAGERAELKITSGEYEFTCTTDEAPAPAINKALTVQDLTDRLSKCGGTQFFVENMDITADEGLFMSASAINTLRRNALAGLEEKIAYKTGVVPEPADFKTDRHKADAKKLHLRFFDEDKIPDNIGSADRVIIPIDSKCETARKLINQGTEVAVEIPVNVFSEGNNYLEKLEKFKASGVELAWACNIDGIEIARKAGMKFACGFGMNVFNTISLCEFEKLGAQDCLISCELSVPGISQLGGDIKRGVLVYGRIPLMVTRNCPVRNKITCAECGRNSVITDRMGIDFPVRCRNGCSFIFNSRPHCIYDRKNELSAVDYDLLYFTVESKDECGKIIEEYERGSKPSFEYTRGLYYKNVL